MPTTIPIQIRKRANDNRVRAFDFKSYAEIIAGETIVGPTVTLLTTDGALTVGSPVVSGSQVQVAISGGTEGYTYLLRCDAPLSVSPYSLEMIGEMVVEVTPSPS